MEHTIHHATRLTVNRMSTHHALWLLVSRKSKCIICVFYCCNFFLYLYLRSAFWGTFSMDNFLEHEVSVLLCFFLLFQFCSVYVKGNGIYYFSFYVVIRKYVVLLPCNLIECRNKSTNSFRIIIRKFHFVVFFCIPALILFQRNECYYV